MGVMAYLPLDDIKAIFTIHVSFTLEHQHFGVVKSLDSLLPEH
jgi:hypothetical protein